MNNGCANSHSHIVASADKASNNNVFVRKRRYFNCLLEELGLINWKTNSAYNIHKIGKKYVVISLGISLSKKGIELPNMKQY